MRRTTQNGKKQVQTQETSPTLLQACVSRHLSEPPYFLLMSRDHGKRIFFFHNYSNPGRITVNKILRNMCSFFYYFNVKNFDVRSTFTKASNVRREKCNINYCSLFLDKLGKIFTVYVGRLVSFI